MVTEETYEELMMLLHEFELDQGNPHRINIASGEDLFNEIGENLYELS